MSNINRTTTCILMALVLMGLGPVATAEPEEESPYGGRVDEDTCYAIRPTRFPPVAIYQCPTQG